MPIVGRNTDCWCYLGALSIPGCGRMLIVCELDTDLYCLNLKEKHSENCLFECMKFGLCTTFDIAALTALKLQ